MRSPITGLRRWLKQSPHPVAVRCDEKTTVRIGTHMSRWSEAEQSIMALDCYRVDALNGAGETLRVFTVKDPEVEPAPMQKEEWPQSETAQIAQAITAACDRAASRHENAYRISFDKLTEMYQAQSTRLEEAAVRCARLEVALMRAQERLIYEPEQPTGSAADGMVAGLLAEVATRVVTGQQQAHGANGKVKQ